MHLSHIRAVETETAVPVAMSAPELEELLVSALAMAVAGESGGEAAAVEVCRHGRDDLTGGPGFAGTVGWLNSVAPYVLRVPGTGARAALRAQIAEVRTMEQTWGALRYLHDDGEVRGGWPRCRRRRST